MKITITEIKAPTFSEFTLFAEPKMSIVKDTKEITFEVSNHTKTRLATAFQVGDSKMGINWKIEGFKTFEESEHSYLTGNYTTSNYFVKSKKQNLESYKNYLKEVAKGLLKMYHIEIDTLEIKLINTVSWE